MSTDNTKAKQAAMETLQKISAVEGFDPSALAVEHTDLNSANGGEKRLRLPVMAQIGWFRLKYPEGRIAISVTAGKDCFVATARVYPHYSAPVDQFLAEATASRGYLADKPTVSPGEWAQTAAVGIALRNAGFGLQFSAAGDAFDTPVVNELGGIMWSGDPAEASVESPPPPVPAASAAKAAPAAGIIMRRTMWSPIPWAALTSCRSKKLTIWARKIPLTVFPLRIFRRMAVILHCWGWRKKVPLVRIFTQQFSGRQGPHHEMRGVICRTVPCGVQRKGADRKWNCVFR